MDDVVPRNTELTDAARDPGISAGLKLAIVLVASVGLAFGCSEQVPSDPAGVPPEHVAGI